MKTAEPKNRPSSLVHRPSVMPLTDSERSVWLPEPRPDICDWVDEHYRLPPEVSDEPGPWNLDYVPYMREPLRKAAAPPIKVGVEGCTQFGKTHFLGAVFGFIVDADPGPTLLLMPRQADVERRVNTRWIPTFRDSPRLLRHVKDRDVRNINIGKETIFDRMIAFLAWSRSPASMSDNSICNVLIDEPGKMELITTTGEDPFDLADKRTRGFRLRSRTVYVTSPQDKGDLSDKQFRSGSDGRWVVPCHACGQWHPIRASRDTLYIEMTDDGEFYPPEAYTEGTARAWYRCPLCGEKWTESRRARAVAAGKWIHKTQTLNPDGTVSGDAPRTRHWSYRVNSLMIHPRFWTTEMEVTERVAALIEMRAGSVSRYKDYRRNQQAIPWEERAKSVSDDALAARVLPELHRRQVPAGAKMLVASADYHESLGGQQRIDFEVRAFGMDLENWVILAGSVGGWEALETQLFLPFPWQDPDCADEELYIVGVFVDSGYKPDEVYAWCAKYPGWAWPIKGADKQRTPLITSDIQKIDESRRRRGRRRVPTEAAKRGQQLILVDQSFFSEQITTWAEPSANTTGQMWFYAEILEDTGGAYFAEFRNFRKVQIRRGKYEVWVWQPAADNAPVHWHDTNRYAAACAFHNRANLMLTAFANGRQPPAMQQRRKQVKLSELPRRRM